MGPVRIVNNTVMPLDHGADEFIEVDSIPTRCGISPGRTASRGRRLREKLSH
jgi:hypothetical protein